MTKEGPNQGRYFYTCSKLRDEQCGFFKFTDELEKTGGAPTNSSKGFTGNSNIGNISNKNTFGGFQPASSVSEAGLIGGSPYMSTLFLNCPSTIACFVSLSRQWQNLSTRTFGYSNNKLRRSATGSHGAIVGWWPRTTNHPRIIGAGSGSVPSYRNSAITFSGRTRWIWRPCRQPRGPAKATVTAAVEGEVEERRKRMRHVSSVSR